MFKRLPARLFREVKYFGVDYLLLHILQKFTRSEYALKRCGELNLEHVRSFSTEKLKNYVSELYYSHTGEKLNLEAPENYNQKIQWLKIFDNQKIKCPLSDKYLVREWVSSKIGREYLVPLLGVWDNPDEINFADLPDSFCLKANHGSGMNLAVRDKSKLDIPQAIKKMHRWLMQTYGLHGYEPQYFNIPRKIIAEEFIEQSDGDLVDYKIHCFDGKPGIIQVIGSRDLVKHTAYEAFFSSEWERNDLMYHTYAQYEITPEKPDFLDDLLKIAGILSEGFKYVRVDLYYVQGHIKFGEMTFTPACGFSKWLSQENNKVVGDMIRL